MNVHFTIISGFLLFPPSKVQISRSTAPYSRSLSAYTIYNCKCSAAGWILSSYVTSL